MVTFIGKVSTRYVGSEYEFEFYVDDEELSKCKTLYEKNELILKEAEQSMWETESIDLSWKEQK